jgi:RecA-family ATPase
MSQAAQLADAADDLPEIALATFEKIDGWQQAIESAPVIDKHAIFAAAAADLYGAAYRETDRAAFTSIERSIETLGCDHADLPPEVVDKIMLDAHTRAVVDARTPPSFSQTRGDEPPAPGGPEDYGHVTLALPKPAAPAVLKTPAEWPNEEPPPVDWLAFQRIPRGDVTTLHGDGGAGKTDVALRLAANVARGAPDWLEHEIAHGPVVGISAEEPEREVRRRIWLHAQHDRYAAESLTDLHLWFPEEAAGAVLATPDRDGVMQPTPLFCSIEAAIRLIAPVLVVVDNVAATFAGNQNDRVNVRSFVNLFRTIARQPSAPAVLLLDHPSLSGLTSNTGRGGNMDWRNSVRSALYLYPPQEQAERDRGIRILETVKSNYGPSGTTTQRRLQWTEGGMQPEHAPSSLHRIAKDQECEQTFLRLLDERNAQGRHVGSKTSGMYAPKEFAGSASSGGFTKHAFAAAMERLFAVGVIREFRDTRRRHDYIDRAAAPLAEAAE